ncbi:hypothetical protein [Megalodesulfovibrio gigas]|uniref:Uncharacterized protein n=1 Tax=Megalodesulfovibrio gigas (strain ATCC 19364 / DSM 1382 / NCIMB 9332 / VKM B-1759) TaxID=1121448 RepID=T2GDA9_MEGG1|nr:hypothetical protein [Megalodesulfovibrio gigas]AGW14154.1 hypothetical protein DGI_2405 [Megalodesulfovibrio gigas DSM 1382 = ATCC 19364]
MKQLSPELFNSKDKGQLTGTVAGFVGDRALLKVGSTTLTVRITGARPALGAKVVAMATPAGYICVGSVGAATQPKKIFID